MIPSIDELTTMEKWWGDAISGKYLDGLNLKFKNKINMNLFSIDEFNYLETKLSLTIKRYNLS